MEYNSFIYFYIIQYICISLQTLIPINMHIYHQCQLTLAALLPIEPWIRCVNS